MAVFSRGGKGGRKEAWLRLSQPRGAVKTTSSKVREVLVEIWTVTDGSPWSGLDWIEVTLVESRDLACARTGAATRARILA